MLITKFENTDFMVNIENCIKKGIPVLLESVEVWIDPLLDPILQRDVYKKGLIFMIKLGNEEI